GGFLSRGGGAAQERARRNGSTIGTGDVGAALPNLVVRRVPPRIFTERIGSRRPPDHSPSSSSSGSHTASKYPIIISSYVCSPNHTVCVGSGLAGLALLLSKCATASSTVPAGSRRGSARMYSCCQLKS